MLTLCRRSFSNVFASKSSFCNPFNNNTHITSENYHILMAHTSQPDGGENLYGVWKSFVLTYLMFSEHVLLEPFIWTKRCEPWPWTCTIISLVNIHDIATAVSIVRHHISLSQRIVERFHCFANEARDVFGKNGRLGRGRYRSSRLCWLRFAGTHLISPQISLNCMLTSGK